MDLSEIRKFLEKRTGISKLEEQEVMVIEQQISERGFRDFRLLEMAKLMSFESEGPRLITSHFPLNKSDT